LHLRDLHPLPHLLRQPRGPEDRPRPSGQPSGSARGQVQLPVAGLGPAAGKRAPLRQGRCCPPAHPRPDPALRQPPAAQPGCPTPPRAPTPPPRAAGLGAPPPRRPPRRPPPAGGAAIVAQRGDGKGPPTRRPADAPPISDHDHKRGPKPDRKKKAIVGTVYT